MAMASKEFSLMPISYPDPATVTKANDQPATDATSLFISFLVKVIFFEPGQLHDEITLTFHVIGLLYQ